MIGPIRPFNHAFVGGQNDHLYNAASRALADLAAAVDLDHDQWRQMVGEMADGLHYSEQCPDCGEVVAPHGVAAVPGLLVFYFSCPNRPCPNIWCTPYPTDERVPFERTN